jgi:hypothetical protein
MSSVFCEHFFAKVRTCSPDRMPGLKGYSDATRRAVVELMKSVLVLPYNYGTTGKSLYTHAVKTSFEYRELELLLKSELKAKPTAVPYDPEFHKAALEALQFLAATIKPMKTHAPIAKYAVPTGIDVHKEQHLETTTQANSRKKKKPVASAEESESDLPEDAAREGQGEGEMGDENEG